MNLYHHYKNKPYQWIGEVTHSETLETLVLYKALYENKMGSLWVRPKEMFFEKITVNGQLTPRFKEVPVLFQSLSIKNYSELEFIFELMTAIFGKTDATWIQERFQNFQNFHLLTAHIEKKAVGFKLGYELDSQIFYSWMGGVLPDYRGLGIAQSLMDQLQEWCRERGYAKIQTKTKNKFRSMLLLNIKNGFDIIDFYNSKEGDKKILLEKIL